MPAAIADRIECFGRRLLARSSRSGYILQFDVPTSVWRMAVRRQLVQSLNERAESDGIFDILGEVF